MLNVQRRGAYHLIYNFKIVQICLKSVLRCQAGIHQKSFFVIPFFETAVVEQLQIVFNDEGYHVVLEALFEEDQAADSAVAVLKGMDALETNMKVKQIWHGHLV